MTYAAPLFVAAPALAPVLDASTLVHRPLNYAKEEDMKERAFICLVAREPNEAPLAFSVCAFDATSAMERCRQGAAADGLDLAAVIGILTQEDVTRMGMLLAAARASLSLAPTSVVL